MNAFAGTGLLVRLALRRDRIMVPAWIAAFVVVAAFSASATVDLYPSLASRVEAAYAINRSQALVALYGRVYDPSSTGALAMIKTGGIGAVFVAMLTVVLVVRHTRADEESGRLELAGGTAMGRRAPLGAALVVAVIANLALAVVTAGALAAAGLPVDGSIAFGLAWAGVGLAFAAIAAAAAQVTTSARTATALSAAVLAVVYVLRATGDTASEGGPRWLSWLSPIGWAQQFRPYAGNRWWVLLITLGFAVVVAGIAFALAARRDLGAGLLATRSGPASASGLLRSPLALAWRLHRGALLGWGVGFALVGAVLGGMASNVGEFLNNPSARDFITKLGGEKALSDAFLALELGFAGVIAAAYGIQVVMRLRSEETEQHAEPVLATAVGRIRWAAGHILVAVAGTTLLMLLVGVAAGLAHGAQAGDLSQAGRVFTAALVQLPAAWVLPAIVVAAFGLAPRFVAVGWVALAGFLLLGELGPLLDLDQWVMDLSPFAHTPRLPGGTFAATPLLALTAVAGLLGAVGLAAFRHRDISGT
jgi:polyether ionophore transport system permease protein